MTSHAWMIVGLSMLLASSAFAQGSKPLGKCPPDAVAAGTICMDKYEASVWRLPDPTSANKGLVKKIQQGKATLAKLTEGGATLVVAAGDFPPCALNGLGCGDLFAVSLPGATPTSAVTWFQAQQACKNARKRLPSNAEWQAAVVGTPGPGPDNGTTDCNTASTLALAPTGSRSGCVSADGAFDMVGNLYEWVAEWAPRSTACDVWSAAVSPLAVLQCFLGAAITGEPGAIARGGHFAYDYSLGASAGPLSIGANTSPSVVTNVVGFRCAR